ncbi:MAG: F0F1 ATP synthase subunit delta [Candidatus Thioglobus sp.]|nr:F0F1 ATP synthase subunit delta [Candidatus Thioglobus sp.]
MEPTFIAKPYANAIFEIAAKNSSHASWSEVLHAGAALAEDKNMQAFIASPSVAKVAKIAAAKALFASVLKRSISAEEGAFVELLLENSRFSALPSILQLFTEMSNISSDSKAFEVVSAYELSRQQQQQLVGDLSKKYNSHIKINARVDENLLGGVLIKSGDKVIDLSIQARTAELQSRLSAN